MVADLLALRRVPARFFGVYMSVNPVFAALIGLLILRQSLRLADWLAIGAIVTANAVSVRTASRTAPAVPASGSAGSPYSAATALGQRDVSLGRARGRRRLERDSRRLAQNGDHLTRCSLVR
jgi:inner membrane transporter RhtA